LCPFASILSTNVSAARPLFPPLFIQRPGAVTSRNVLKLQSALQCLPLLKLFQTSAESVSSFRHLGRQKTRTDSDWGGMHADLRRARYKWQKLSKLLHREGADPRIFGMFCKAVVQTVVLFGCESWTVTDAVWTVLKGFHHQAVRRMVDMMACRGPGGGWIPPSLEEALKKAGVHTMERCVSKRQQHAVDCISARPVWMHCMVAWRQPGTCLLVGSKEKAGEAC